MVRAESFAGVILAAGASSRMGRDKALLPWRGGTFLSAGIASLSPFVDFVLVVAGENYERVAPVVYAAGAFVVRNPEPSRGQFSSLRVGLSEVLNRGRDAAIVTLVDRPAAERSTVGELKREFLERSAEVWAVVPEYEGRHGHPYVAGREMIEAFLRASAESNAREVEHAHQGHMRYVRVGDAHVVANVDTPEEYARLS